MFLNLLSSSSVFHPPPHSRPKSMSWKTDREKSYFWVEISRKLIDLKNSVVPLASFSRSGFKNHAITIAPVQTPPNYNCFPLFHKSVSRTRRNPSLLDQHKEDQFPLGWSTISTTNPRTQNKQNSCHQTPRQCQLIPSRCYNLLVSPLCGVTPTQSVSWHHIYGDINQGIIQ